MSEKSEGWLDQKNFNLWEKPPLLAYLTPRQPEDTREKDGNRE